MNSKLISLQVGMPRLITRDKQEAMTGIFKAPVENRLRLRELNLEGDQQADLSVHGGPNKAVYAYPSEHYPFWRKELPELKFPWGAFGENLTTSGLLESAVCVGDRFRIGTAEVVAVSRAGGMDQQRAGAAVALAEVGALAIGTVHDDAHVGTIVLVPLDLLRRAIELLGDEQAVAAPLEQRRAVEGVFTHQKVIRAIPVRVSLVSGPRR